jgi:hypothetical protein
VEEECYIVVMKRFFARPERDKKIYFMCGILLVLFLEERVTDLSERR